MVGKNRIYFLCGNARTFLSCFDSAYENIISKLFENNNKQNTHILFYLKCDDPGPRGVQYWDFEYDLIDKNKLKQEIERYEKKYKNITFHSKLLDTNEIGDNELLNQVKDRSKYVEGFERDKIFLRALHFNYNIEQCGKIIEEIQKKNNIEFDFFIFIRPDLFFSKCCSNIDNYNKNKVICSRYAPFAPNEKHATPLYAGCDLLAIIPNKYKDAFFFERMRLIRTNTEHVFKSAEPLYLHTLDSYQLIQIGDFKIKRI